MITFLAVTMTTAILLVSNILSTKPNPPGVVPSFFVKVEHTKTKEENDG